MESQKQQNVHRNALNIMINYVSKKERSEDVHFVIDQNQRVKNSNIKEMVDNASKKYKKNITAEIVDSKKNLPIQTNDFVVGSMGKKYNRGEGEYIKRLNIKIHRKKLRFHKARPMNKTKV